MPYLALKLPPGIYRAGSTYGSKGRWMDSNLMRWVDPDVLAPIGGWSSIIVAASVGSKPVRGMLSWRVNDGTSRLMLGTYAKAFVYISPTTTDVTPAAGFTAGTDSYESWQFDVFGEDVVACLPKVGATGDGKLWYYDASVPTTAMTLLDASAPVTNLGVFVTHERFIVALGAGGNPRLLQWPDQESISAWAETATNQAGNFPLASAGTLLAGRRGRGENLIWTTTDLWAMRYTGDEFVYGFTQVGAQCGAISSRSMAMVNGKAIWMGRNGFYEYDGFVRPLSCEVGDFIFGRQIAGANLVDPAGAGLDRTLADYVVAVPNTPFNEVTWYYPSVGTAGVGSENDRYVTFNYVTGAWYIGALARSGGVEDGGDTAFGRPVLAAPAGDVYMHEMPAASITADWGSVTPYVTSGPIEIGEGDRLMMVRQYVPDSKTLGDWRTTIYGGMYPTATETTYGPYTSANPTSVRLTARQIRLKIEAVTGSKTHRFGVPRIEMVESHGR